jgi:hypothetical protein
VNPLPAEAEQLVARIESLLDQASRLPADGGGEAAFGLRETERRYLPDTLRAYADIPPASRDATAQTMLVEQLRLLERATAQRLAQLAESAQSQLAANGAFLGERFGALAELPVPSAVVETGDAPPATLVRRMLERLEADAGPDPGALLARAAERLAAAFPTIATVTHGGFLGRGPVTSIALDVPRRDDLLRYMLARAPHGGVDASVTRFLRGIKNKTLSVDIGEWTRGLIDDLGAYVERERSVRDTLNRIFREQR